MTLGNSVIINGLHIFKFQTRLRMGAMLAEKRYVELFTLDFQDRPLTSGSHPIIQQAGIFESHVLQKILRTERNIFRSRGQDWANEFPLELPFLWVARIKNCIFGQIANPSEDVRASFPGTERKQQGRVISGLIECVS